MTYILAMVILLLFAWLPVSAQDRCVANNNRSLNPIEMQALERLLAIPRPSRYPDETAAIRSLQERMNWEQRNGVGNGWVADRPDSCVLYISASSRPVRGTRVYRLKPVAAVTRSGADPGADSGVDPGALPARVSRGPARIRSGPGLEYPELTWCGFGWSLTVWTPATEGWLRASCYGVHGWIHGSLVQIDDRES